MCVDVRNPVSKNANTDLTCFPRGGDFVWEGCCCTLLHVKRTHLFFFFSFPSVRLSVRHRDEKNRFSVHGAMRLCLTDHSSRRVTANSHISRKRRNEKQNTRWTKVPSFHSRKMFPKKSFYVFKNTFPVYGRSMLPWQ